MTLVTRAIPQLVTSLTTPKTTTLPFTTLGRIVLTILWKRLEGPRDRNTSLELRALILPFSSYQILEDGTQAYEGFGDDDFF